MKEKKNKIRTEAMVMLLLAIALIGWLIWTIVIAFWTPPGSGNKTITFQVVGVTNSTNATTLVSVHFECIKYCAYQFSQNYQEQNTCYSQCATLGKEECGK